MPYHISFLGFDLYTLRTDNAEMLMRFTDLPQSDSSTAHGIAEDPADLSSFTISLLLEQESRDLLEEQYAMRGPLFRAVLCYALEWVCLSYWRMGSYPAQILCGVAAEQWLRYATWCARKSIHDPLKGRLVDVLGRIWAWIEEPYLDRLASATKVTEKAQAKADLRARQVELFGREV